MESNLCPPTFYEHNDQETYSWRKNSFLRIIQDFPTSQTKQKNGKLSGKNWDAKRLKLGWIFKNESISWKPGISWVFVSLPIDGSSYKSFEIKFLRSIDIFDRSKHLRENLKLVFTKRKWKKEDLVCLFLSLSLKHTRTHTHTHTHLHT